MRKILFSFYRCMVLLPRHLDKNLNSVLRTEAGEQIFLEVRKSQIRNFFLRFIFTLIEQIYIILYILLVEYRSCCPHCFPLGRGPPLGPAVQQADALLSEPRRKFLSSFRVSQFCIFLRYANP
jgi:hypothetical protein